MKYVYSNPLYVAFTSFFLVLARTTTSDGKLIMTVVLNNGILPTVEGYNCTTEDASIIASALGSDNVSTDDDGRRGLQTSAKCRDLCRGYKPGTCHALTCKGYRRRMEQRALLRSEITRKLDDDDDDDALKCAAGIETVTQQLAAILPNLSSSCQPIVQSMRQISCFDDVLYAAVEGFQLLNANTDQVVKSIQDGDSFCYKNYTLTVEALTNACVEDMEFVMTGPVSISREQESAAPYSVFGHSTNVLTNGTTAINFSGRIFPIGSYVVKTEIEDSLTPNAEIHFSVKRC